MAGTYNEDFATMVVCGVNSVDSENRSCTCTPLGGKTASSITNVQLMAEVEDGFLLEPAVGSTVIVCYSKRNVPYIALFSELSKVSLVTLSGISLQGEQFGGLVKIEALITKLNNLENAYNALNTKVGGLAPPPLAPLILTIREELENEEVKHGTQL